MTVELGNLDETSIRRLRNARVPDWFSAAMRSCRVCRGPAKFFRRDDTEIVFACAAHVPPRSEKWQRVDALGGAVLSAQRTVAELRKLG